MSGQKHRSSDSPVDITDVFRTIEDEGVEKFIASWAELADTVQEQLDAVTRR